MYSRGRHKMPRRELTFACRLSQAAAVQSASYRLGHRDSWQPQLGPGGGRANICGKPGKGGISTVFVSNDSSRSRKGTFRASLSAKFLVNKPRVHTQSSGGKMSTRRATRSRNQLTRKSSHALMSFGRCPSNRSCIDMVSSSAPAPSGSDVGIE